MRKFIKNIVLFIGFAILFYTMAIPLWKNIFSKRFSPNINYKKGAYGHMYSRIKDLKNTNNLDVLFLGSSHSYRGFDTRIFKKNNIKSFNLGSSSQTPNQTITLLKRYLDNNTPKLIIYEVYPPTISSDGVESSIDLISNDKNDIHSYSMAFNTNNIKTWNTLLYASFRDLFKLDISFKEPIKKGDDTYIEGGFVEKKIRYYSPQNFNKKEISLNQKQLNQFEYIISMIKNKGIKLILVYAPIPKANYLSYTNNTYYDSLMTTYSEYYNFNKIIKLNDSLHFYDSHHLNQNGVIIFNNKLIDTLKKQQIYKLNSISNN